MRDLLDHTHLSLSSLLDENQDNEDRDSERWKLLTYLFRGIGQNIQPLTSDEIERIQDERIEKIKSLGLSGLMSEMSIPEENGGEVDSNEEKEEIMDKVTEDLEDFGQTE